jgi:RNA polymerase sigma factor (sigma-70 family)
VYSVALRQVRDPQLAQDVTQTVFTKLARQARSLGHYESLVGWLHTTTRYTAIDAIRGEARRRTREQEASLMHLNDTGVEINWAAIGPLLDEAVGSLREGDRQAVLLRYFQNCSHQEIGAELGLSENSANKRIERALDKLRAYFTRRGVTTTTAILALAISANSVQAAPLGLAEKSAKASLAGAAAAGGGGALVSTLIFMNTKVKIGLALGVLALLALYSSIKFQAPEEPAASVPTSPRLAPPAASARPTVEHPAQVAAPVAPPVVARTLPAALPAPAPMPAPAPVAVAPAVPAPAADPRLEISTAMTGFVGLLESGDYATAVDTYFQIPPNMTGAQLVEALQKNPDFPNTIQMLINATKAAQTEIPTYDETGNLATYQLAQPTNGKTMVRWKKIDGMWRVDAFE